jgi:Lipase (class 3)
MTTLTNIDYALMAGGSYISNRDAKNRFPVPQGWVSTKYDNPPNGGGFEAISFIQSGTTLATSPEIVISFAGTNGSGDIGADVLLGLGAVAYQLEQAAAYYLEVKAANPNATITFTGHSLGGGLASLLGVLFAEKAVTFDQAPFASAANVVNAQLIKAYLATLPNGGYVAGAAGNNAAINRALANLDAFINATDTAAILANRVARISNTYVQGEVLSTAPFGSSNKLVGGTPTQLDQTSITLQPFGLSSVDLHSQALLPAFLQSPSFEAENDEAATEWRDAA